MTGYGDDARLEELLAPLARLEPLPFAGSARPDRSWARRPVLLGVAAVVALAAVSVALAAGFGAFKGISAAQGPQTPAALRWAKQFHAMCRMVPPPSGDPSVYFPPCHILLASARLLSPGSNVYVVTDTRGDLCMSFAFGGSCGPPLSASQPITFGVANTGPIPPGGTATFGGVALDGVKSVSFTVWGKPVTVAVKNNTFVYTRRHSDAQGAHCIVAHMADGSSVRLPDVPCP